jgi:SpoVK/Ycf46/Vps4 family AAA+-type ATPase
VILPEPLLGEIERHTLGIGRRVQELRAAGRHVAAELSEATVIVLAGGFLGITGPVCRLARELSPSLVVLEDVDLIAGERTMHPQTGSLLFELLNELDGMADDADVAVVLTTNRADLLEPALATRPGRVDLAVELPLPDAECRRRLLDLYARGLPLELRDPDAVVESTEGVTASFFRELLRQAALEAADEKSDTVRDEHVAAALDRLLTQTSAVTRTLLGAARPAVAPGPFPAPAPWLEGPAVETDIIQFEVDDS